MTAAVIPEHPAKFSAPLIDRLGRMLVTEVERIGPVKVLDPFAGVGGVHALAQQGVETFGVELQPEWAAAHADTICGSVLELPSIFPAATFDVLVTSPCYGNRMADHHDARDQCKTCDGSGRACTAGTGHVVGHDCPPDVCSSCKGSGMSDRNTYTHKLRTAGAEPVAGSAAMMHWGPRYRQFHADAWKACRHVLKPGGLVLLNASNFYVGDDEVRVVEFHLTEWLVLGATLQEARRVATRRNGKGANREVRVDGEMILALRLPR